MSKVQTFEEFLNEERVYGLFNDGQGKPSKLSKEILDISLKGLPKDIIDNIKEVEPAGWKNTMISPPSVTNKGQSRGVIEYTSITIYFEKPVGRNKITSMIIGLRKRTSGPGTGYLAIDLKARNGHNVPGAESAIEFYMNPNDALSKLYNEKIKPFMK